MEKDTEHALQDRNEDVSVAENLCSQESLEKPRPSSERNQSAGGAFLHVFRQLKGNCVYGFFLAWENPLGESKVKWGIQNDVGKDVSLCQCPMKTFMQYYLELGCHT